MSKRRGRVTSARATLTRIFMPPDKVCGNAAATSARPTEVRLAITAPWACGRVKPANRKGSQTLSNTLAQGMSAAS